MAFKSKEQLAIIDDESVFRQALQQTVDFLRVNWFEENVGIVAATLVEGSQAFSATSLYLPDEHKWLHAETIALQQFEKQFGRKPNPTSTMVVTLSPCLLESSFRQGASCTHKIIDSGITQVRFGFLDVKQTPDIRTYRLMGLDAKLVEDQESRQVCGSLYELFDQLYSINGRFHDLLNSYQNPWSEIKRVIGLEPFNGLD